MRNLSVVAACALCALAACKLPSKPEDTSASATASATAAPTATPTPAVSAAPAAATDYSHAAIREIPENCKDARIVLTAVPKAQFDDKTFKWRFAQQVLIADPAHFKAVSASAAPKGKEIVFSSLEHLPTKGVALVAQCSAETCMRFGAAYKTVVPTSHPEVVCGKVPTVGAPVTSANGTDQIVPFGSPDPAKAALPEKTDIVGQCVRLAACQAAKDFKLDGDPAIECQKHPGPFKLACAAKASCEQVLECAAK
jgi:hypothetical protein